MRLNSICVVSEGYPYKEDSQFSFVEQLCVEFSKQGINVTVISPQSWIHVLLRKEIKHPLHRIDNSGGLPINVYRPFLTLSPYKFWRFNDASFKYAVSRQFSKLKTKFDVCYGHFWNNAYYISGVARKNELPLFVASGEGNFDDLEKKYKSKHYQSFSKYVSGVICVSSSCRDISVSYGLTSEGKCVVLPNGINNSLFRKLDKYYLREQYGFSKDDFIVAFVGSFINRKGSNRVSTAISKLQSEGYLIKSFFIGKSQGSENLIPNCNDVIYCGSLEHAKIPEYLNMADVFVLPTLNEGCCNAIIEAMACGLPIISSDRPFNHDVLNANNSILIDPNNVDEIASSIKRIYIDKALRLKLSDGALKTAERLSIVNRARNIVSFIEKKI